MFGIRKGLRRLVGRKEGPSRAQPHKSRPAAPAKSTPKPGAIAEALTAQTKAQQPPKPPPAAAASSDTQEEAPKLTGIAAMIAAGAVSQTENEIDLSVSYTSGPAAEAAARAMAERDMITTADDGTTYWGPTDNESARAKADGQELVIDQEECIHCGTCVENTEQVFVLPDDAKAVVIAQEGPMELIQDAIDACPVTCIHWTEEPEQYPQLNDAEGLAI